MRLVPGGPGQRLRQDGNIDQSAEAVVRILENAIEAVRRMRHDSIAKRGKGTQISIRTEYDFQNLTEMAYLRS